MRDTNDLTPVVHSACGQIAFSLRLPTSQMYTNNNWMDAALITASLFVYDDGRTLIDQYAWREGPRIMCQYCGRPVQLRIAGDHIAAD